MGFTYDLSTPAGRARLLIPDTIEETATFDDAEIEAFLDLCGGDPYCTAATALETIAASKAMILKTMTVLGVSTDGSKVAASLLERAARLRASSAARGDDEWFGVAAAPVDEWTWRQMQ
jgi:hypothetical protein